ncbi:MAG: hypothetical protein U9Q63_01975 [Patescibacteria group bacterium]|nr:hypothetical protein [Patescibacteria group bacterium]
MDSVANGTLFLVSSEGVVDKKKGPFLTQHYKACADAEGKSVHQKANLLNSKHVNMMVRWGVNEPFPCGLSIWGRVGIKPTQSINFITFPKQPLTAKDAQKTLQIPEVDGKSTQTVGVFNQGKRIIISRKGVYKGKKISMVNQFHLIGSFDGKETGRTYWMYGSNGANNKTTVTPVVKAYGLVPNKV